MDNKELAGEELVKLVTRLVVEALQKRTLQIPVGVSNRHIHLSRADMDVLFGAGSQLKHKKDLRQPGQYAAEETVEIKGPRGSFGKVRVLGPLRSETQLEISAADGFVLGIHAPVRESGKLEGTPGFEIIGPKGTVKKDSGIIVALRHIHMPKKTADLLGLADKQMVKVAVGNPERGGILTNVLVRASEAYALEMHIDLDEANALSVQNGDTAQIVSD